MTVKLMYISNDDTQNITVNIYFESTFNTSFNYFNELQLVVETLEHSTEWYNQLKFTFKVPKAFKLTNKKNVIIKRWGLV